MQQKRFNSSQPSNERQPASGEQVQQPRLPYAHLNLRRNPFGELTVDDWVTLADVEIEEAVATLSQSRTAIQYVGEKGHGKTTHLLAINSQFPNAGYLHIPDGKRRKIPAGSPILIDEAQRLAVWQRWWLFCSSIPLVLGTHRDFRTELVRAGRQVTTIEVAHQTDAVRLHRLLNARIAAVRRGPGRIPAISPDTTNELLKRFGPNVRAIVHALYSEFQTLSEPTAI